MESLFALGAAAGHTSAIATKGACDLRLTDLFLMQLPQLRTTLASHLMRRHAIIAAEISHLLVDEYIASDFTKVRRTM